MFDDTAVCLYIFFSVFLAETSLFLSGKGLKIWILILLTEYIVGSNELSHFLGMAEMTPLLIIVSTDYF